MLSPMSPTLGIYSGNGHTGKATGRCAVKSSAKGRFVALQPSKIEQ